MKLLVYDPAKQKDVLIGEIQDGVLHREVKPEHFMKIVDGYGIQENGFQKLITEAVKEIVMRTEAGTTYSATVQTWLDHSKVADYGHGKQRFLSLKYMTTKEEHGQRTV